MRPYTGAYELHSEYDEGHRVVDRFLNEADI